MPLYYNEDSTNFFFHHDTTGGKGGAALDAYLDRIAAAGVTTLLCNTNAQRTNYLSQVWDATWDDGFDPDGPDDQPYLTPLAPQERAGWRRLATNMLALHDEGVDYPARVIARCRRHGVSPWITLRVNDVHDNDNIAHPIHSRFWRQHPQYWRRGCEGYFARALDFGHAAVRDAFDRLVDETLTRYDLDGLELDFLREPYLFSRGQEDAGRSVLTAWLAAIRARVDAAAHRRGRPVRLGARSPSRPAVARAFGLDPVAWAHAGLIDLLVVSPRWSTVEYEMPLTEWRRLLAGTAVTLAGGLEILIGRHPGAPKRPVTAEEARGAAAQVLHAGADAVYLFNYFQDTDTDAIPDTWTRHAWQETLASLASLDAIARHPRRHAVTFADLVGPEGTCADPPPLPAAGALVTVHLPTGPAPAGGSAELLVELEGDAPGRGAPRACVNAADGLAIAADLRDGQTRRVIYRLPVAALDGAAANRIRLASVDGGALRVVGVDVRIAPG